MLRRVISAVLISLGAGLASVPPVPHAVADAASLAGSPAASLGGPARPITAYVANIISGTVTPIATATNTAGPPITTGTQPIAIAPATVPQGPTGPIVSGYRKTKCVDDSNNSSANGTKIVMWDCNETAEQDWTIEADGTIQINGKCMDIYREEKTNKAPVELWAFTGRANQQWQPRNGTLVNGTQLEIYTCNGGANQQWKLPHLATGTLAPPRR